MHEGRTPQYGTIVPLHDSVGAEEVIRALELTVSLPMKQKCFSADGTVRALVVGGMGEHPSEDVVLMAGDGVFCNELEFGTRVTQLMVMGYAWGGTYRPSLEWSVDRERMKQAVNRVANGIKARLSQASTAPATRAGGAHC